MSETRLGAVGSSEATQEMPADPNTENSNPHTESSTDVTDEAMDNLAERLDPILKETKAADPDDNLSEFVQNLSDEEIHVLGALLEREKEEGKGEEEQSDTWKQVNDLRKASLQDRREAEETKDTEELKATRMDRFIIATQDRLNSLFTEEGRKNAKKFRAFAGAFIAVKLAQWGFHELDSLNIELPNVDILGWLGDRFNDARMLGGVVLNQINPVGVLYGAGSRMASDYEQNKIDESGDPDKIGLKAPAIAGAAGSLLPLTTETAVSSAVGWFGVDAVKAVSGRISAKKASRPPKADKSKPTKPKGSERRAQLRRAKQPPSTEQGPRQEEGSTDSRSPVQRLADEIQISE